ncbi:MAG: methyl-accepting chemotaxis protein [Rhodocyclales bacterium]|nr:methyl-accepting chemotaxis protein [Rhodocyclales bacterium]
MSLRNRFRLLLASIVAGFLLFGALAAWTLETLRVNGPLYGRIVQGKDLIADILPPPEYIIESYLVALRIYQAQEQSDPRAATAAFVGQLETLKKDYDTRHAFWRKEMLEPELERMFLDQAHKPATRFYETAFGSFLPAIREGRREQASAELVELERLYEAHRQAIDAVVAFTTRRNEADEASAQQLIVRSSLALTAIFLGAVLGTALLATLIARSVLRAIGGEINTAALVAERIADGDLSVPIAVAPGDRHSLFAAIARMREGLADLARQIQGDARSVTAAAESLATLAGQLQTSVASQSDSSTTMAATIEEMSANIRQIADNAEQALSFAAQTGDVSRASADALSQVAAKVEMVSHTVSGAAATLIKLQGDSARVSTVTQVIRDVADQTNLLALNAAIEAARAGESGRGFAVVADEVRKLAERTATATKEIGQTIDAISASSHQASSAMHTTVAHTEAGVRDSITARDTIVSLQERSRQVSDSVHEIGLALREQTAASDNLSTHVSGITALSERNTTTALAAADAARALRKLAESLHGAASRFRVA